MNSNNQDLRPHLKDLKANVRDMLQMVSRMESKKECIDQLTKSASYILLQMVKTGGSGTVPILEVSYLMGQVLPVLEAISNDKGMLDEGFGTAVAIKMHKYYAAIIEDIEKSIEESTREGIH